MPVLVTSNCDDDSIKNEQASMETPFSHYKSMEFFRHSRAANSIVSGPTGRNSNLSEILCMFSLPASLKRIRSKATEKGGDTIFPIISQWGLSVAMDTRVLIHLPQNIMQPFPTPSDATHKI